MTFQKLKTNWFCQFLSIFLITNIDRIISGSSALVRNHDWYDSLAHMFPQCFAVKDALKVDHFNNAILSGYDCFVHGIPPWSPIAWVFAEAPGWLGYFTLLFVQALGSVWGAIAISRVLKLKVSDIWIVMLGLLHYHVVIGRYVSFSLDPIALLMVAWALGYGGWLAFAYCVVFAISVPSAYIFYHVITTAAIAGVLAHYFKNRLVKIWFRLACLWAVISVLHFPTALHQVQIAADMMRKEMWNYWGPHNWSQVFSFFFEGFWSNFALIWALGILTAIVLSVRKTQLDKNVRRLAIHVSLILLIAFVLGDFCSHILTYYTENIQPRPALLTLHWSRFYLTLPSLQLLLILVFGLVKMQPLSESSKNQRLRIGLSTLAVLIFAWLWHKSGEPQWYSMILFIFCGMLFVHEKFIPKWNPILVFLLITIFIFQQRREFSLVREEDTFSSTRVQGAEALAELYPNEVKEYRSLAIAYHPMWMVRSGLTMADGYLTTYPNSYRRVWEEIFRPSLTNGYGDKIMPYFKYWGGRAYVFLPGSGEGAFQTSCPAEPIDIASLANISLMGKIAVRWIVSKCPLKGSLRLVKEMPEVDSGHRLRRLRYWIFGGKIPVKRDSSYVYELPEFKPIFESEGEDLIVRAHACFALRGQPNIEPLDGNLGFRCRSCKTSPAWPIVADCYSLH